MPDEAGKQLTIEQQRLRNLGLTNAEVKVLLLIHQAGRMADNRSLLTGKSQAAIAKAIGYGRSWTIEALDNLEAFGLLRSKFNGRGKPKSYLVDWSVVNRAEPVRAPETGDPFAEFSSPAEFTPESSGKSTFESSPESTPESTSSPAEFTPESSGKSTFESSPESTPKFTSPSEDPGISYSEFSPSSSPSSSEADETDEAWGRAVDARELRTWEGRWRLFQRACEINPRINFDEHSDRVGFVAACLCASERGENPAALLLAFVRRRAWQFRGRRGGGIDGFWLERAAQAIRQRDRERGLV